MDRTILSLQSRKREVEQSLIVRLEMNAAGASQNLSIAAQKTRRGEAALPLTAFGMRLWKGNPNFFHFAGRKVIAEPLDQTLHESDVLQVRRERGLGALPNAITFDINADEIALWKSLRQADRISAAAACEFQGEGMIVFKVFGLPFSLHRKRVMKHIRQEGKLGVTLEFLASHASIFSASVLGIRPAELLVQAGFNARPFGIDDAEKNRMPQAPALRNHMIAERAFFLSAKP